MILYELLQKDTTLNLTKEEGFISLGIRSSKNELIYLFLCDLLLTTGLS